MEVWMAEGTDTPRTDEKHRWLIHNCDGPQWVILQLAEHARQLERELAARMMALQAANSAIVDLQAALQSARKDERERCAKQVPTNWLDPLLTGPDAVLEGTGPWGCPDIAKLLRAVKARIALGEGRE